jgi:hypothetical protein
MALGQKKNGKGMERVNIYNEKLHNQSENSCFLYVD